VLTSWGKSKKENTRDWRIHGIHACHGLQKKEKLAARKESHCFGFLSRLFRDLSSLLGLSLGIWMQKPGVGVGKIWL
jgi:hypothetical protein